MKLAHQRAIELNHQKEALLSEFANWRERTKEGQPEAQQHMEKHNTQIRRITAQLEGFLAGVTISDGDNASFDANERAFTRILGAFRMWDYFRSMFALRDVSWLLEDLVCADELAWECYLPARERAATAKTIDIEKLKEPPLVFFSNEATPFAQVRNTPYAPEGITERDVKDFGLATLRLPIPVIGMPWFQLNHLPAAVVIGHEVGHAVEHDFDLDPIVVKLINQLDLPLNRKTAWLAWRHEVFADVYGVLSTGPATVLALIDYLMDDEDTIQKEILTEPNWGNYPTRFLRMELNFELLNQLDLLDPTRQTLCALAESLGLASFDPVQEWRETYEFHLMGEFEQDLKIVVKALLDGPYPSLGNLGMRQVIAFDQKDLLGARERAFDVIMGNALAEGDPLRRLYVAATLAYHVSPQAYADRNSEQALIQRMRAAIPKGVRSADGQQTDSQIRQREIADREAGRKLLDDIFGE